MSILAVAWDIDGTLVDSEPVHLMALKATCRQFGADISDLPDNRFIGVSMLGVWRELYPRMPGHVDRKEFLDTVNTHYRNLAHHLRPMPRALAAVSHLARAGLRQVAVSNSARVVVDANLALGGLGRYMEFSLSLDDVSAGKPAPEPYLEAARRLGMEPEQLVAVEDSDTGAQSARAAGLSVIRIDWPNMENTARGNHLERIADLIIDMARRPDNGDMPPRIMPGREADRQNECPFRSPIPRDH